MTVLYIVGHPGAGKGLIAQKLAEKLGWVCIDADFGLEFRIGKTIETLMGREGSTIFLAHQHSILSTDLPHDHAVIVTDSSVICHDANRQFLSQAFVVNIAVSVASQLKRIARQPKPLSCADVGEFFAQLHEERDVLYKEVATLTIDSDHGSVEEHIATIVRVFSDHYPLVTSAQSLQLTQRDCVLFHKTSHAAVTLSKQHALCVKLLAEGKSSKEIARALSISYRTVEGYLAQIMERLGCANSKELIALYHHKP